MSATVGYNVYKGSTKLNNTLITNLEFTITGLIPNTFNGGDITVYSVDAEGNESQVAAQSPTILTLPAQVTGVTATASGTSQINLNWAVYFSQVGQVYGTLTYRIYRGIVSGVLNEIATTSNNSFTDSGLSDDTEYFYRVEAYNATGAGSQSAEVSATTEAVVGGGNLANPTLVHLIIRGQSQAGAYLSTPALTTSSLTNTFALGPLSNGRFPNTNGGNLVPLAEYDVNATRGESPATSMAQEFISRANDPNLRVVVTNHSLNSAPISRLAKGGDTGLYEESIAAAQRVKAIADSRGEDYQAHVVWFHGGAGENPYKSQLQQLINDYKADLASIVTSPINMFIDQIRESGSPDFSIQAFELAQEDADVTITHPRYQVEYTGDNVHLTPDGTRHSGSLLGRAISKKLLGTGFKSFQLNSTLNISGSSIVVGTLNRDGGTVTGTGDFGLEAYDVDGSATIPGTFAISGTSIVFTPTTPLTGNKLIEIRSKQGATGELYVTSSDVALLNDTGGNPYSLNKYLARHTVSSQLSFSAANSPDAVADLSSPSNNYHSIDLSWSIPADNGSALTEAVIEVSEDLINWTPVVSTEDELIRLLLTDTSYKVEHLFANTEYNFRIRYINANGGSISNTLTLSTNVAPTFKSVTATGLTTTAYNTINIANDYPTLNPGDTLVIPAGVYARLRFENFIGSRNYPLNIVNDSSGVVEVTEGNYSIGFYDANYINLKGDNNPGANYGFVLHPETTIAASSTGIGGYASGLNISYCNIYNCGFAGLFLKKDLSSDPNTWRINYRMDGLKVHNNYIHATGGEGMYIGTTIPATVHGGEERDGHLITNVEIFDNLLENLQWDGIQVSKCPNHKIYRNTINNFGLENQSGQNKGIAISNESSGDVFNNIINTGLGSGIDCFGDADNRVYNNLIIDAGENGIFLNDNTVDYADGKIRGGYLVASNTIVRPTVNGIQVNGTTTQNKSLYNNILASVGGTDIVKANSGLILTQGGNITDTVANLLFTDQANGDFTLQPTSPAIDAGINLNAFAGLNVDITGSTRPKNNGYDSGAYEKELLASAPTNITLSNNVIAENNNINAVIGTISASGTTPITFSLAGADSSNFSIINGNQLVATEVFDFETKSSYIIDIDATNSQGLDTSTFTINITDVTEGTSPTVVSEVTINSRSNGSTTNPRGYIEATPPGYGSANDWGLIIWLHGLGEAGNGGSDLSSLNNHAIINYINNGNDVDYLVLAPQSFNGYFGGSRLRDFIEWALIEYAGKIDETKIHLACVSASGAGIDGLINNYPTTLAKINTITVGAGLTGNGTPASGQAVVNAGVRTWWHWGENDTTVGIGQGEKYYGDIVNAQGGQDYTKHRFTKYLGMGHSAWQETYDNSGRNKSQDTGSMDAGGVGNYYLWADPVTWYSFLEGGVIAPTAPTEITIDNSSIDENQTGIVGQLFTNGNPAPTLAITAGGANFSIDGSNNLVLDIAQDFETTTSLSVTISSTNSEGSVSQAFTINITDVNDDAPTDIALSSTSIPEVNNINDVVGTLSFTGGGSATYSLVAGTGDTDNASFNISGSQLRASEVFDFETKTSYDIRLRVTTAFGTYEEQFTITITDVAENVAPTDILLSSNTIDENNSIGDTVGMLSVDQGTGITYSLVAGTGDTDNASFSISGSNLNAGTVFDFETKSSYSVRIQASNGQGSFSEAFTITIGDVVEGSTIAKIDFSLSNSAIDTSWNALAFNPHQNLGVDYPLDDTNNVSTGWNYRPTVGWNPISSVSASNNGGESTGANSGEYPDTAMQGYHFGRASVTPNNTFQLRGLNSGKTYDLKIFASRDGGAGRITRYTIGGVDKDLNVGDNTSDFIEFLAVSPDGSGIIECNLTNVGANEYVYIGVLEITEN